MKQPTLDIVGRVHRLLTDKSAKIAVAESCTGGLLSHILTQLPGSSAFFETGIVSYSAKAKEEILGVPIETITSYGVVSEETARVMAERVRTLAGSDFSISTTGNLGPEVLEGKNRGLIYIAVSSKSGTVSQELRLYGNRETNKEAASLKALELLLEVIEGA